MRLLVLSLMIPGLSLFGCDGEVETDPDTGTPPPPMRDGSTPDVDTGMPEVDAGSTPVDASTPPTDGGTPAANTFEEVDGIVAVEAENYTEQARTEQLEVEWYTFRDGAPDPTVSCVTDIECTSGNRPTCNEHPNCDGDSIDPAEAAGNAYVEALPDRRRTDDEANTGNLGVVGDPNISPVLRYHVYFTQIGRYYVWGRARGQGPAANGIHVGVDGTWPRNDLIDPSSMRMQFPSGWQWTQNRRGGTNHTGVPAGGGVSRADANIWLEIDTPGMHVIEFAMREDGLEFDKFVMALDPGFTPADDGPAETRR